MKQKIVTYRHNQNGHVLIENIAYMAIGTILGTILSGLVHSPSLKFALMVGLPIAGFFLPVVPVIYKNIIDRQKEGPQEKLIRAARKGKTSEVERLAAIVPDAAARRTGLLEAAFHNRVAVVELLIKERVELNGKPGRDAPLIAAASRGHITILKLLLEAGADLHAKERNGWSALVAASRDGHTEAVRFLLRQNCGQEDRELALREAAYEGRLKIVSLLLTSGVDINAKDSWGQTALMKAASFGQKRVVKFLLQSGSDKNITDNQGLTA